MPFTNEDKHLIKVLHKEKHYSSRRFLEEFPNKNWSRRGLDHLLQKIDMFGSIERQPGTGCVRTAWNDDNVDQVADLVLSQEDRPQTRAWRIMQEKVYRTPVTSVDELKGRLVHEWAQLDHVIDAKAIGQWRRRLTACVKARGHFEHKI
jgi:hypothetical protein